MRQESELQGSNESYSWLKTILVRQLLLWHTIWVMARYRVGWNKARATVDEHYYQKCMQTGQANILYRPAQNAMEVGPQNRLNWNKSSIVEWLVVLIIIWVLSRIIKKAKR